MAPLVGLAAALYLHHSASAIAAAVPLDVRLLRGVATGLGGAGGRCGGGDGCPGGGRAARVDAVR